MADHLSRFWIAALALLLALVPAEALACPNCVLRENTPGRMFVFVAMMLLPWTVVGLTVFAIRRTMHEEQNEEGSA